MKTSKRPTLTVLEPPATETGPSSTQGGSSGPEITTKPREKPRPRSKPTWRPRATARKTATSPPGGAGPAAGDRDSTSLLKELPADERPRERLLRTGAAALSDAELLAVLLRTGLPGRSAVQLARQLLLEAGGLDGLLGMGPAALRRPGLGAAKTAALLAALEVGRRLSRPQPGQRQLLDQPAVVARYLLLRHSAGDQEVMGALYLDVRNRLLADCELFRGTLDRASVEPRAIFKEALLRSASAFVLFHTHPSGDPSPSAEDLAFTRRLAAAGETMGIRLLDHLILARGGRWTSLQRRGGW